MEPLWVQQPEQAAERVVARDAVFQAQKLPQEVLLRPAEQRHVRAGLAATNYRAQRNHQNFVQRMQLRIPRAGVFQALEKLLTISHRTAPLQIGASP